MLKFGQLIDLEKLERLGINKAADELREKIQREENKRLADLEEWNIKTAALKEKLTDITKENTIKMEKLVQYKQRKYHLESNLNTSQASMVSTLKASFSCMLLFCANHILNLDCRILWSAEKGHYRT